MGIFLLIILIVQIRVPFLGLNGKKFSIFTLSKAFKIFETWASLVVKSVVILQIFRVELTAYEFPIFIFSLSVRVSSFGNLSSKYSIYFSGSRLFLLAVSIKLKIIADDCAPLKLCENNQFFSPITNVLIARSA